MWLEVIYWYIISFITSSTGAYAVPRQFAGTSAFDFLATAPPTPPSIHIPTLCICVRVRTTPLARNTSDHHGISACGRAPI
ncbi:hypothetical protein F5Y12DRAFT_754825 [Xylaria sp. FL1777]|nr:hypothetical protein F5Y12DRAFT_754825 [Xylaria sp. FL1777]